MAGKLRTILMASALLVAVAGSGIAIGAARAPAGVKACVNKKSHALALLVNGKCGSGFAKVTIAQRGPRGKAGPPGPGATTQTLTAGNNDELTDFPKTFDGFQFETSCGMASGVTIDLTPKSSSATIDVSGTGSHDGTVTPVDIYNGTLATETGNNQADLDVIADVNGGTYAHFDIHGTWANNECHYWLMAIPSKPSS